jgi:hypothetical protein
MRDAWIHEFLESLEFVQFLVDQLEKGNTKALYIFPFLDSQIQGFQAELGLYFSRFAKADESNPLLIS